MYFYYFMIRRYQRNYLQLKCFIIFLGILIPAMICSIVIHHYSLFSFHALLFASGWVSWTFLEYILHRFHMHKKNAHSSLAETHQHHHTHPTEIVVTNAQRTGMVFFLLTVCAIAVYFNNYFTCAAGFCFGMVGYFMMHKILHQKIAQRLFKRLVKYHIYHHCKYPNTCFGISVPWWDDLFGSVPKNPRISQRIIDFYFNEHEAPAA